MNEGGFYTYTHFGTANTHCNNDLNRSSRGEKKYTEIVVHFCLIRDCYKVVDTHYRRVYAQ